MGLALKIFFCILVLLFLDFDLAWCNGLLCLTSFTLRCIITSLLTAGGLHAQAGACRFPGIYERMPNSLDVADW